MVERPFSGTWLSRRTDDQAGRTEEESAMDWETAGMRGMLSSISVSAREAVPGHHQDHPAWTHNRIPLEKSKQSLNQP